VEDEQMMRAIKITFLTAAILGLGFGVYLGYSEANEVSDSLESIQYIAPAKIVSDFARIQFMRADTDHARQAVLLQIDLLERLEQADKTFHEDGAVEFAYIRLAMIEEAAGQPDAEQHALAQARARYRRVHSSSEEMTDDELKKVVKRLDQAADNL
jgi:hypothetical protein